MKIPLIPRVMTIGSICIAACCGGAYQVRSPADLQQYLAEIQRNGMSEGAWNALWQVGSIMTSRITLACLKDSATGVYFDSYQSTTCPNPKLSKEENEATQRKADLVLEAEVKKLKPFADSDASGFVSTAEGEEFRRLI